jgi:formylglycine-generating enzyme required for sulfatase activity
MVASTGRRTPWLEYKAVRVQDAYQDDAYLKHFRMNPVIENGKDRILRGGSWLDDAGSLRSTTRYRFNPDFHYRNLGFRLARDC